MINLVLFSYKHTYTGTIFASLHFVHKCRKLMPKRIFMHEVATFETICVFTKLIKLNFRWLNRGIDSS